MTVEPIEPATSAPAEAALRLAYVPIQLCQCGHGQAEHTHDRPGKGCDACGPARCRRFRRRAGRPARASLRRTRAGVGESS